MRVRRPLAALSLAAALLAATTACSGDDPPEGDGSPSASPATSPSASSPTASTTADPPQRESAKAFIRRWFAESDAMQKSGDTTTFRAMGSSCGTCETFADSVDRIYQQGGWIRFGGTRIHQIVRSGSLDGNPHWNVQTQLAATRYRESSDGDTVRMAGGPTVFQITLTKADSDWRVADHSVVAE